MPACAPNREFPVTLRRILAALSITLLTAGCTPSGEDFGIQVDSLNARATATGVDVRARQVIRLSAEAREALRRGVPLRFRIDVSMRERGVWADSGEGTFTYEIRYLPLSDHYQLSGPGAGAQARTFPRLRHVLSALSDVQLSLAEPIARAGPYEVRVRSRLDRSGMPGPMQLPVLLSPAWNHDSGWVSSELALGG